MDMGCLTLLPKKIKEISIPRAILENKRHQAFLSHTIERFGHEEKKAIYYCATLEDATLEEVVEITNLSINHVTSTLVLFAERLERKLMFLQIITPHDKQDTVQLADMLFAQPVHYKYSGGEQLQKEA